MRISKEKAAENRAALIRAASKLFRARGIDGVGVAEISKEAGLTHGALYAHFKSKEELALEALSYGLDQAHERMFADSVDGVPDLARFLDDYFSVEGRDDYGNRCAIAASASEIGRQDKAISARFAEGYMMLVRVFEHQIAERHPEDDATARALVAVSAMIGSVAIARGAAKGDPALSAQVLRSARRLIGNLVLDTPAAQPDSAPAGAGDPPGDVIAVGPAGGSRADPLPLAALPLAAGDLPAA
ncbi:TetR/AcrR family transcriptional regulator [Massilia forsythiae]|uniref:TetR/AcrR family transcriptional regulator n=1 Tax=Massilia forsythiae TaxID=2728020 RepID=UPI001476E6DB|nr:TetR/AcrR family transcriptional regulator [Massilia forsythiae]